MPYTSPDAPTDNALFEQKKNTAISMEKASKGKAQFVLQTKPDEFKVASIDKLKEFKIETTDKRIVFCTQDLETFAPKPAPAPAKPAATKAAAKPAATPAAPKAPLPQPTPASAKFADTEDVSMIVPRKIYNWALEHNMSLTGMLQALIVFNQRLAAKNGAEVAQQQVQALAAIDPFEIAKEV